MKSEELLARFGIAEDQLRLFRYRGYGNPGPTRIETEDGRAYEVSYQQLWEDESKWMIQPRCKICPDAIGEAADIVASGTWPGGGPTGEDEGSTALLSASRPELFEAASAAGAIIVERQIDFRDLDLVQPHQVRKKRAVWARHAGMQAAGLPVPRRNEQAANHPVPVSTVSRKISAKRAVPVIVPSRGGLGNRNPGRDEVS